jgi:hypothetical protein
VSRWRSGSVLGQADGVTTRGGRRLGLLAGRAAMGGAVYGPALEAFDVLSGGGTWSWAEIALRSAFFAVAVTVLTVAVRRYSQDIQERAAVARVLSAGTLPPGAEPDEWAGRLRVARYRLQYDRTAAWGFSLLLAALVAAAALQSAGPDVGVWLYAAALLVAGVVLGIRQQRRMETAARLSAELEERLARA